MYADENRPPQKDWKASRKLVDSYWENKGKDDVYLKRGTKKVEDNKPDSKRNPIVDGDPRSIQSPKIRTEPEISRQLQNVNRRDIWTETNPMKFEETKKYQNSSQIRNLVNQMPANNCGGLGVQKKYKSDPKTRGDSCKDLLSGVYQDKNFKEKILTPKPGQINRSDLFNAIERKDNGHKYSEITKSGILAFTQITRKRAK